MLGHLGSLLDAAPLCGFNSDVGISNSGRGIGGHLIVRAPNWVGDVVMATPVFEAARESVLAEGSPWESLSIVIRSHLAPVLAGGGLDPFLAPLPKGVGEREFLKGLGADATLLLTTSFGAALRAFRAGIPIRAGAALSGRGALLTHKLVPPARDGRRVPIPTAHLMRDLAGLVGLLPARIHPQLDISAEARDVAHGVLRAVGVGGDEPYVLCCPGAAFGAAKLWPPPRFAEALEAICKPRGWRAVVTGGPGEERLMDAVCAAAPSAVSLAEQPRDLASLKELVRGSQLLLVGDSGPRWYAAAFDVPCVSVMGPNFPELTASSLEHCEVVRVEGLDCSPCLQRHCPLEHHACMVELQSSSVVQAAERVLASV
jgi:heptosyltransferase-2